MRLPDFGIHKKRVSEQWYDLADDWDLIVASFASQYQMQEADIAVMEWREFSILLAGIMPKTPLGMVVQIRAEEDKDILKHFTAEQQNIRNVWRNRHSRITGMSEKEKEQSMKELQNIFAKAFGGRL